MVGILTCASRGPASLVLRSLRLTIGATVTASGLAVCAVFYGIAYGRSFGGILKLVVSMVLVDFVLVGIAVSTLAWWVPVKDALYLSLVLSRSLVRSLAPG
jgi:hypothetical protein